MEEIRIGRIFILVSQNLINLLAKIELCLVFNYHVFPDRIQQTMNGGLMVLNGFLCKDWHSTSSYLPMQTGEVANWIINKVTQIIEEIESRDLPM